MCKIALYVVDTWKTILQKYFQIGRPICKSAGQSVIGRLASQFANWPDWQIRRNICIITILSSGICTPVLFRQLSLIVYFSMYLHGSAS